MFSESHSKLGWNWRLSCAKPLSVRAGDICQSFIGWESRRSTEACSVILML